MSIALTILARCDGPGLNNLIRGAAGNVDEILICYDLEGTPSATLYGSTPVKRFYRRLGMNFGAQRNYLLEQTNCDWTFTLDTDEMITDALWHQLRDLTTLDADLIAFPRANVFTGVCERLSWPDYQPRLAKRHLRWSNDIHEAFTPPTQPLCLALDSEFVITHTKTADEQREAIARYSQIRPMRQGILVFEWKRPNYLKVCLDSLERCHSIENWPILLSIDGPGLDDFSDVVGRARHLIPWAHHAGNLWHITRSLEYCFHQLKLDRVLFMDGDCILRPDTLANLPESNMGHLFVGLDKGDGAVPWLSPQGNLVERTMALPMLEWVGSRAWVGKPRPGHNSTLGYDYPGYDAVYCRYLIDHGLTTLYRDKAYAAHIGVCGLDCHNPELERQIFTADPSTWLANAVHLHATVRHPSLVPVGFKYED